MRKNTNPNNNDVKFTIKVDPKTKNVTVFGLNKIEVEKVKSALKTWLEEDKKERPDLRRVKFSKAFIIRSNGSFKIKKPLLQIAFLRVHDSKERVDTDDLREALAAFAQGREW